MALSPEQNKVFDEYDKMFASEGWKMLTSDLQANKDSIFPTIMASGDINIEHIYFLKGRADVYDYLLSLKQKMEFLKQYIETQDE